MPLKKLVLYNEKGTKTCKLEAVIVLKTWWGPGFSGDIDEIKKNPFLDDDFAFNLKGFPEEVKGSIRRGRRWRFLLEALPE